MKRQLKKALIVALFLTFVPCIAFPQKKSEGVTEINSSDLESHLSFLASPLLKGRMNGEPGLEIAADYIASQARLLGLRPANGESYFQPYSVIRKSIDMKETSIEVISAGNDTVKVTQPLYQLYPQGAADFVLEGEVVFAGYGIKNDKFKYNDFENVDTEGKILLVMNRSPLSEDGGKSLFDDPGISSYMGIQAKIMTLVFTKAKAVLFVADPKSGFSSVDEQYPGIAGQLSSELYLKGTKITTLDLPGIPRMIFVHREIADELLKGTGYTLGGLQKSIDSNLKPNSFGIKDRIVRINEVSVTSEETLRNVAAFIEGSDPVLKDEVIVFSAHMDHVGGSGDRINTGADDNASGCSALLELADAFNSLEKKPLRSILFLWVSGEEIGLFGSKYYVENPLFPLKKTVADLNMDMIGRVKGVADTTSDTPMTGATSVFAITGNQSSDLMRIAEEVDRNTILDFDYSLSGKNHPLQLFARSDHYNFVRNDIPVFFFSTGIHTDYHTPRDVIGKIDFKKMELITRAMYEIGFALANRNPGIVVDNPFSKW